MTFTSFEVFQIKNGSKISLMTTMTNSKKVALSLLFMIKGKCVKNNFFLQQQVEVTAMLLG
ncbi:hypothetical protein I79_006169 [Cricetulus griseus]|uniref:Uncharacterized protein n=1 Tax=Cricetulus griseus TaxID=10029 RepID=G3H743_CRIGR|nr:hypothetical protein I79_006169 [Cricetulus griseus]